MPLKHNTETWLLVLLAFATALAGFICAFLPPVTVAWWPWALAFVAAVAYPFALYPLFKARRADYPLRALHFAPAALLLLWLIADLAASAWPNLSFLQEWMMWKTALIPVAVVFVLILWFCLAVIRQRRLRIALLAVLLLALGTAGFLTDAKQWNRRLAANLWGHSGSIIAMPGTDDAEERWRAQLRLMEERRREIAAGQGTGSISSVSSSRPSGAMSGIIIAGASSSSSSVAPNLPHAGPTADVLVLLSTSGFCAALHRKTVKRRIA